MAQGGGSRDLELLLEKGPVGGRKAAPRSGGPPFPPAERGGDRVSLLPSPLPRDERLRHPRAPRGCPLLSTPPGRDGLRARSSARSLPLRVARTPAAGAVSKERLRHAFRHEWPVGL